MGTYYYLVKPTKDLEIEDKYIRSLVDILNRKDKTLGATVLFTAEKKYELFTKRPLKSNEIETLAYDIQKK